MRFDEIRKTGKKVLVDMSRRQRVLFRNDYGLETFKMAASRHWVEGVVIDRRKGKKNESNRIVVAVNQRLIDEALSCPDIQTVLKKYEKDTDYKELSFSTGYNNRTLFKAGTDIYYSGIEDEKVKNAVEQDKGVLTLLRKDAEQWTDADLQSFYHYFMAPNFGYREDYTWTNLDDIGLEASGVLRHARFLYGIRELASGWNETQERYRERLSGWEEQQYECYDMEKDLLEGFIQNQDIEILKGKFEKYCISRDANRGISLQQILRRREKMADAVAYRLNYTERDLPTSKALEKFYTELALNPGDEAKKEFVMYKKTWED